MKKFFAFLKWHYNQWSPTQIVWLIGCMSFGAGLPDYIKTNVVNDAMVVTAVCWLAVFAKWFVWDMVRDSWKRFEKERSDLFKTIDEGK